MNRVYRIASGLPLCLLALYLGACAQEQTVKQAEPKVAVTTQALLTCSPVAQATGTSTTTQDVTCAYPSGVTLQPNDIVIAFVTTRTYQIDFTSTGVGTWTEIPVTGNATVDNCSSNVDRSIAASIW